MSYRADKQVIDTHTDRYTDGGDDNTQRPKLASGNNASERGHRHLHFSSSDPTFWVTFVLSGYNGRKRISDA